MTRTQILQNAAAANGNGTELALAGAKEILVQIIGASSFAGDVIFEARIYDTWTNIAGRDVIDFTADGTITNPTNKAYTIPTAGWSAFRARVANRTVGNVTVRASVDD